MGIKIAAENLSWLIEEMKKGTDWKRVHWATRILLERIAKDLHELANRPPENTVRLRVAGEIKDGKLTYF